MSFRVVHDAIRTRFATLLVSRTDGLNVIWDNAGQPEQSDDFWARVSIRGGASNVVELGAKRTLRQAGVVIVQIFEKLGRGTKRSLIFADEVREKFKAVHTNGIVYRLPSLNPVGQIDGWWQINVTIPFFADEREV